jgi:multiple sugar transport system substrate-binding protein
MMLFLVSCSTPESNDNGEEAQATEAPAAEEETEAEPPAEEEAEAEPPAEEETEAEPPAEEEAEAEPVDLLLQWWGSQSRHDITIAVVDAYMAENPNVNITYEFSSFPDHWTILATKAAAGSLPDVIQQDYAYFIQYVTDDLLLPLDPFVESGVIDLSNVPAEAVDGGRVDGELYALNLGTNSQSFVIDVDLFEAAGVEIPAPDWTWADFEETANALHEALGIYGIVGGLENPQIINALYLSRGEGLYNDDGTALGFTDAQPLIDYFAMMVRLQESGAMVSREVQVAEAYTLENNPLVAGEGAMYFAHTNQFVGLYTAAGEDRNLMMVPVPRAVDGTQSANYFKPSMFFSITSHSQNPEEAAKFINYFTNSIEANEILAAERGVPISTVVQEAIKPSMSPAAAASFDFLANLEVSPIRPPDPPQHGEIQTNITVPLVIDPLMFGEITAEEAAQIYMDEINALLGS